MKTDFLYSVGVLTVWLMAAAASWGGKGLSDHYLGLPGKKVPPALAEALRPNNDFTLESVQEAQRGTVEAAMNRLNNDPHLYFINGDNGALSELGYGILLDTHKTAEQVSLIVQQMKDTYLKAMNYALFDLIGAEKWCLLMRRVNNLDYRSLPNQITGLLHAGVLEGMTLDERLVFASWLERLKKGLQAHVESFSQAMNVPSGQGLSMMNKISEVRAAILMCFEHIAKALPGVFNLSAEKKKVIGRFSFDEKRTLGDFGAIFIGISKYLKTISDDKDIKAKDIYAILAAGQDAINRWPIVIQERIDAVQPEKGRKRGVTEVNGGNQERVPNKRSVITQTTITKTTIAPTTQSWLGVKMAGTSERVQVGALPKPGVGGNVIINHNVHVGVLKVQEEEEFAGFFEADEEALSTPSGWTDEEWVGFLNDSTPPVN